MRKTHDCARAQKKRKDFMHKRNGRKEDVIMAPSKAKKLQHPKRRCSGFFFFLGRCPNAEEMEELYMSIRDEVIRKHKTYKISFKK